MTKGHASLSQAQYNHSMAQSAPLVGGQHFSNVYQQTTHSVLPSWCLPLSSLQVWGKIREKGTIKQIPKLHIHTCTELNSTYIYAT